VNENSDNENMLQFWWYASLARHLGIGGLSNRSSVKYKVLKEAMNLYKKIKSYFTRGIFYGINNNIHLHVDEIGKLGVVTAYNLNSRAQIMEIKIDLMKYGLDVSNVEIYNGKNQRISSIKLTDKDNQLCQFKVEIPPLSPIIAILQK
jgi:hypothetical protein